MSALRSRGDTADRLRRQIATLRQRLEVSEETLGAIRSGEVDAITVDTPAGERVFTLKGAEQPYRVMVEAMSEGAVTITPDGVILYSNQRFADMLRAELNTIIGSDLTAYFSAPDAAKVATAIRECRIGTQRLMTTLLRADATSVPVNVALHAQTDGESPSVAVVISDLSLVVAAQAKTTQLLETLNEGLIETDEALTLTYVNPRFAVMLGYPCDALIGQPAVRFMTDAAREKVPERVALRKAGRSEVYEISWLHHAGHEVPTRISSGPHFDAESRYLGSTAIVTDLTEWKRAEGAKERADRALRLLNACNTIIIRATNADRMLADTCQAIVDVGGYKFAWIGYAEHDAEKSVRPVAWAGSDGEYVARANITWSDSERGRGPTGTAIRTGRTVIARDTDTEPGYEPWRQMAQDNGYRSSASMPLRVADDVLGALMIYAPQPDAFDEGEARLLTELADDLAFGIVALRNKHARDRLAAIVESADEAIIGRDLSGTITSWNRAAERLFGYQAGEIVGQPMTTLVPREIAGESDWLFDQLQRGETVEEFDTCRMTKDGRCIGVSLTFSPIRDAAGEIEAAAVLMHDNTARKNAEEALQFRERNLRAETDKLHSILDSMAEAVLVTDKSGRIIESNRAARHIQGGATVGDTVDAWLAGCDLRLDDRATRLSREQNPLVRAIAGDLTDDMGIYFGLPNGTGVDAEVTGRPIRAPDGTVAAGVIVYSDISRRKQAEADLRAASAYARSLIEASLDPLVTISAEGRITDVNKATEDVTGLARDNLIGSDFSDYFTEPERARAGYRQVFAEGYVTDYPLAIRHVSGSVTEVLYNASTYRDEHGDVAGVFAAARDITKRKEAEQALAASETRFRTVLSSLPQKIFLKDLNFTFLFCNENFARDLGITPADYVGKNDYMFFPKELADKYRADDRRVIETGQIADLEESYIVDGVERAVQTVKVPMRDEHGKITGLLGIFWDITERKQAEAELRQFRQHLEELVAAKTTDLEHVNRALEAVNKELEAFAYSVSHDLRVPLRAIDGFSQILQEDYGDKLDSEGKRVIQVVRDSVRRMAQLIEDILAFSRIGRSEIAQTSVDMAGIVQAVLQDLAPELAGRSIEVRRGELPPAKGDGEMLRQVWINLLHNAIKFTARKDDAVIEVGAREEGQEIVYFVKDNGAGFDMQYAGKLFGVFQRLHNPGEFPGTGLGLAIVKKIVGRHGGRVWAEGKVDEGATFYFTLPAPETEDG